MNKTSEDVALLELFENGKTSDKKYKKLPAAAIKGYVKAVNKMRAATRRGAQCADAQHNNKNQSWRYANSDFCYLAAG